MKKEIMELWTAALRSGNYKQGKQSLKDLNGNYCVLGVLCEISGLGSWKDYNSAKLKFHYRVDTSITVFTASEGIQPPVIEWAGITPLHLYSFCPVEINNEKTTLTTINDSGKSFNEIADIIEQNYEKL